MAEYSYTDEAGRERMIVQPRVLAQTTTIERHVIRSEVPGLVIEAIGEAVEPSPASRASNIRKLRIAMLLGAVTVWLFKP
jgi:hypothetical protein